MTKTQKIKKPPRGLKSFRVPKGHPRLKHNRKLNEGGEEENNLQDPLEDDPTASEKKLESIPLLLFGDYDIIIEKK